MFHRKVLPDGGIFDKLTIDRLAIEVVQPDSSLYFQYANKFFVRSRTYDTKAGGRVGVGLLTPGVGEPGA